MQPYHKAVDIGNSAQCVPCEKGDHECCRHDPTYERCGCHARGHGQPLVSYEICQKATLEDGKEIVRVLEHGKCTELQLKSISAMASALGWTINVTYPSRFTRMGTQTLEDWMRKGR